DDASRGRNDVELFGDPGGSGRALPKCARRLDPVRQADLQLPRYLDAAIPRRDRGRQRGDDRDPAVERIRGRRDSTAPPRTSEQDARRDGPRTSGLLAGRSVPVLEARKRQAEQDLSLSFVREEHFAQRREILQAQGRRQAILFSTRRLSRTLSPDRGGVAP